VRVEDKSRWTVRRSGEGLGLGRKGREATKVAMEEEVRADTSIGASGKAHS
jgi:hypothetical protein